MESDLRHSRERRHANKYGKMLGLCFLEPQIRKNLTWTTTVAVLLFSILEILFASASPTKEYLQFSLTQYANLCVLSIVLRWWWLYYCNRSDHVWMLTTKIVISSLGLLLSLAISFLAIITMTIANTSTNRRMSNFIFFFTYAIMIFWLSLNIANWVKLIFLIIILAKPRNVPSELHRNREHRPIPLERPEDIDVAMENFLSSIEGDISRFRSLRRQPRHRRFMRRLNHRVPDGTLQAIHNILNAALERHMQDTPLERVKIYSRIEGLLYNAEKHGNCESCPIWCEEFKEDAQIKLIPVCNHIFHEDCIEQWILKARTGRILCPVCRIDIKGKLDELENAEEEDMQIHEEPQIPDLENLSMEPQLPEQPERINEDEIEYQTVNSTEAELDESELFP